MTPFLEQNRLDLQLQLTRRTATALFWISLIMAWALLPNDPIPFLPITAALVLFFTAWAILRWVQRESRWARFGLVGALTLQLLAAMVFFPDPWLPFASLLLVLISSLLFSWGGLLPAISTGLLVILLNQAGIREYPQTALLTMLAAGLGFTWLAVNTTYHALSVAQEYEKHATELLEETRKHRGELGQSLQQLRLANDLLRRTQQELRQARRQAEEARRAKERFAANISHELRTPLNLIIGFSEVMQLNPEVYGELTWPATLRRDIFHIFQSSRHLLEMIDDILDLSRLDTAEFALNLRSTPLEPFLLEVINFAQPLFRGKPISFQYHFEPGLPELEIDFTRIRQVLLNLLNNAVRYTEKGLVTLSVEKKDQSVIFSVSDTGPGIPEDKFDQIFQEFYQLESSLRHQYGGAGLGLAISRHFVNAHGGNIWVESEIGKGATFFFSVPIHTMAPTISDNLQPVDAVINSPLPCILLVNAKPEVARILRRHLTGYEIFLVQNPLQVEESVRTYHPFAIIWNNPEQALPLLPKSIPIIECTLSGGNWIALQTGVQGVITKPASSQQLLEQLGHLGERHRVLIVDDDPGFVQLVERIFQAARPDIVLYKAYNGQEGFLAIQQLKPDMVFMDIRMPDMTGIQVLEQIHADPLLAEIPVVLLTATAMEDEAANPPPRHISLRRGAGLTPGEVLHSLSALLKVLQPRESENETST